MGSKKEEANTHASQRVDPVVSLSETDSLTPGVQVEYTADEAERNGAFRETAMSESDAWESNSDIDSEQQDSDSTEIVINGKNGHLTQKVHQFKKG